MNRHVIFAVILSVAISGCIGPLSEKPERQYASAKEARADGALNRGWIPAVLPSDAHAIREVHDIATNLTWGCFSTEHVEEVRALLAKLMAQRAQGPIGPQPHEWFRDFSWWPEPMRAGTVEAWQFTEAAANPRGSSFVVRVGIDGGSRRVCFHRAVLSHD
jgi:hypothetical protein